MLEEWPIIFLTLMESKLENQLKMISCEKIVKEIFDTSKKHSCIITYPEDVMVGKVLMINQKKKELNQITNDDLILDIGPKTINKNKRYH